MQAIILAGGKGTRLTARLDGRPKPLVDVCGVPLLERQIAALSAHGVDNILLLVNHRADQVARFCVERQNFGIEIRLIDDGEPLGTAGALLKAFDALKDEFLIVYGDTLFDVDIASLVAEHRTQRADVTLLLHPNDHPADSDLVDVDDAGWIKAFHAYPHPESCWLPNLVNAAFYVANKEAFRAWQDFRAPSDLAKDLFPAMLLGGAKLRAFRSFEYIKDLGTPSRLDKVERDLRSGKVARSRASELQRCVFVDRDGTLNCLAGYVRHPSDLILIDGVATGIRRLNEADWRVAVVTNQPVVARGECSFDGLREIHNKLDTELGRKGAFVDGFWLCPHHPDKGFAGERPEFKFRCDCRKPEPGLILAAAKALNVDLNRSWVVGDSTADLLAARRAGVRSILVETGEAGRDAKFDVKPDFVTPDFSRAVDLILETL